MFPTLTLSTVNLSPISYPYPKLVIVTDVTVLPLTTKVAFPPSPSPSVPRGTFKYVPFA